FESNPSTFNTLAVSATDGAQVSVDVNTDIGGITINADNDQPDDDGTLTVAAGATLNSANIYMAFPVKARTGSRWKHPCFCFPSV
ncbi:MAG: hypothetical protein QGF59_12505, partial [Pirellulaceae bacterium]|nr:hypothetical protein [Pirellulaceae bacterium]